MAAIVRRPSSTVPRATTPTPLLPHYHLHPPTRRGEDTLHSASSLLPSHQLSCPPPHLLLLWLQQRSAARRRAGRRRRGRPHSHPRCPSREAVNAALFQGVIAELFLPAFLPPLCSLLLQVGSEARPAMGTEGQRAAHTIALPSVACNHSSRCRLTLCCALLHFPGTV